METTNDDDFRFLTNCSLIKEDVPLDQPSAAFFLKHIDRTYFVLLMIGSAVTALIVLLSFVHWYNVWTYVSNERRQNNLYWLLGLFPFSSICCLIGMFIPRTALLTFAFAFLYFMVCLFSVVTLLRHLFGGRAAMAEFLAQHKHLISFQMPPFCCCCRCLPKAPPAEQNLRRVEWLVLQAPFVRTVIAAVSLLIVFELREDAAWWLKITDILGVISMLFAIFGCHTLSNLAREKIPEYGFMAIFRIVDFALLLFGVQKMITDTLARFNVFTCGPLLTPIDKSHYWNSFFLIIEMFLLSLLSTFLFKPSKNAMFDKYPGRIQLKEKQSENVMLTNIVVGHK
uniref:Uncharacterized protein n=1 Tax=Plectus sambesii TaxID=2011161 RepID=A0A914V8M7_9BILA